jgi:hypothetical protein
MQIDKKNITPKAQVAANVTCRTMQGMISLFFILSFFGTVQTQLYVKRGVVIRNTEEIVLLHYSLSPSGIRPP